MHWVGMPVARHGCLLVCALLWAAPYQAEAVVKEEKPAVKKGGLVAGQRVLGSTKVRVALWEALAFPFCMHSSSLFRWDTAALFASRLSPRRLRVTRRLRFVSSPPSPLAPPSPPNLILPNSSPPLRAQHSSTVPTATSTSAPSPPLTRTC